MILHRRMDGGVMLPARTPQNSTLSEKARIMHLRGAPKARSLSRAGS
jgi:hypothetical protein